MMRFSTHRIKVIVLTALCMGATTSSIAQTSSFGDPIDASSIDFDNQGQLRLSTESMDGWFYEGIDLPDYNPSGYPQGMWSTWHIWSSGGYSSGESCLTAPFIERWVYYDTKLADGVLKRSIVGLPEGTYTLTADIIARQQGSKIENPIGAYLFMETENNKECVMATTLYIYRELPQKFSVEIEVKNGTLNVGLETENSDANWLAVDNMILTKNTSTGVLTMSERKNSQNSYSIQGTKFNSINRKGIYINNGRKIIVK